MLSAMAAPTEQQPWTIVRLLNTTRDWLSGRGVDEPRVSAELLLAHVLGCRKIDLYTAFERVPDPEQLARYRELVRRAGDLVPIAYLIGTKEFYSLEFEVTPDVLIPRPETEALVSRAISICRQQSEAPQLLDVGTGSGCIAVAVCRNAPAARCLATDVSEVAIEVARRNIDRHGLAVRISTLVADGLDLRGSPWADACFDLVLSNPPYVAVSDTAGLAENVRRHEPHLALFAGSDGLQFFRLFAESAAARLRPGGTLLLEIGAGQKERVLGVFAAAAGWHHAGTYRDAGDPHERVLEFRRIAD